LDDMKKAFQLASRIYIYLFFTYVLVFGVFIVYDDWVFVVKYWSDNWLQMIGGWLLWCLIIGFVLSIYYWIIAFGSILLYSYWVKRRS
jgi:hypothetical protein